MSDDNTGPLSRLLRGLGIDDKLPVIAAIKRIEERPVSLNPEVMFKLAPTPDLMSDAGINRLWDGGPTLPTSVPITRAENARAFDLHSEYTSFAPEAERWTCIDLNTYDGAPDSEAPATFIGRGASEKEARMDLLAQFYEHDNPEPTPRPRPGIPYAGNGNSEPVEYRDAPHSDPDDDVTFDDDLEDQ